MPAKIAVREDWSEARFRAALIEEQAKAAMARAKRAGHRLAGTLYFRYRDVREARVMANSAEGRTLLRQFGVMEPLWPMSTRIADGLLAKAGVRVPHGGTVLPAQKRQYFVRF